ncbi:hypothetical protein LV75_004842 [Actinokineospora diospyrosa]|uniref:Uncharacterized protein n=1 Tax=Actinokineospora diospyrosa TaxID=103728 RepID=A0ABT1IIF5_9PSEU|nr:hypothetical protein [Actinokineospora diospyrosa]
MVLMFGAGGWTSWSERGSGGAERWLAGVGGAEVAGGVKG